MADMMSNNTNNNNNNCDLDLLLNNDDFLNLCLPERYSSQANLFDEYLNNLYEDKFESSLDTNSYYSNTNTDKNNELNQTYLQWLTPVNAYNQFSNQFDSNNNNNQTERVDQSFAQQIPQTVHTFGEHNYYNQNRLRPEQELPPIAFNGFQPMASNDNLFPQNNSQIMDNPMEELSPAVANSLVDETEVLDLPQQVTQLNGQLLSAQEFEKQNNLNLFCDEKLDDSLNDIPQSSSQTEQTIEAQNEVEFPSSVTEINDQISIDNNNNIIEGNALPKSHKTYSRVLKVVRVAPLSASKQSLMQSSKQIPPKQTQKLLPKPPNPLPQQNTSFTIETIAAVKGLVMLSNSCRETVIQTKGRQKTNTSQMSFAERQRLKRERNRIASKKCRQKKLETIERLEVLREHLYEENEKFETYLKSYKQRLMELKQFLLFHRLRDCQMAPN